MASEVEKKWEGRASAKLTDIDRVEQCLSYEFVDNNIGYGSYMATMKLLPFESSEGEGTEFVWSVVLDPVEGWTLVGLVSYYDSIMQGMTQQMNQALGAAKEN
ncbi:hypothetical protein ACSBR1_039144 [Camellia fascicularis]